MKLQRKLFLISLSLMASLFISVGFKARNRDSKVQDQAVVTSWSAEGDLLLDDDGQEVAVTYDGVLQTLGNETRACSFSLKNLSKKPIRAAGLLWVVTWSNGVTSFSHVTTHTTNSLTHPDIARDRNSKLIEPQSSVQFEDNETVRVDGKNIVKARSVIDFVEFSDGEVVGKNTHGLYEQVLQTRRGCAMYKEWLVREYKHNGRTLSAINARLWDDKSPSELQFPNNQAKLGGALYRNWLRDAINVQGVEMLEKILSEDQKEIKK
jgi:hypothetical protein